MTADKRSTPFATCVSTFLTIATTLLVCLSATEARVQDYQFPDNSQNWRYWGLYDGEGLTRLDDFLSTNAGWTGIDGNGGTLLIGQDGFMVQSPSGEALIHGDLISPELAYEVGKSFELRYRVSGARITSNARVGSKIGWSSLNWVWMSVRGGASFPGCRTHTSHPVLSEPRSRAAYARTLSTRDHEVGNCTRPSRESGSN